MIDNRDRALHALAETRAALDVATDALRECALLAGAGEAEWTPDAAGIGGAPLRITCDRCGQRTS